MFKYKESECPTSSLDQEKTASVLGCSSSQYHCMRDQRGNLGEICVVPSWIPAGYCPEYNTDAVKVDAEKCDKSLGLCPKKTYMSNEVLSYSACLKRIQTTYPQISTDVSMPNTSSSNLFETTQNPSWPEKIVIPIIASVSVCILIAIIVIIIAVRRRPVKSKDKVRTEEDLQEKSCLLPDGDILEFYNGRYFNEQFEACKKAKRFLESRESILIVGTAGSGKTSLCVHLYNYSKDKLFTDKPLNCVFLKEIKSFQSSITDRVTNLIFLDDCFESWMYMTYKEKSDLEILQRLYYEHNTDREKALIIVMTMDFATWDILKPHLENLNAFKNVLDISRFDNDIEKQTTCEYILQANGVEIAKNGNDANFSPSEHARNSTTKPRLHKSSISSFVTEWSKKSSKILGLPLTCILLCTTENLFKKGADLFASPFTSITREIMKMRDSFNGEDTNHYLTLVYTLLLGKLDMDSIDNALKERLENEVMPNLATHKRKAQNNTNVKGSLSFFEKSPFLRDAGDNQYIFMHDIVLTAVLSEFGNWNTTFLLQYCNMKVLLKFVGLDEKDHRPSHRGGLLLLPPTLYKIWARRLADTDQTVALAHITLQSARLKKEYQEAIRSLSRSEQSADLYTSVRVDSVEMEVLESH